MHIVVFHFLVYIQNTETLNNSFLKRRRFLLKVWLERYKVLNIDYVYFILKVLNLADR